MGTVQRIINGFVIQDYDDETGKCIEQHFIGGEEEWEDNNDSPGEYIDKPKEVKKLFPCDMKQPK